MPVLGTSPWSSPAVQPPCEAGGIVTPIFQMRMSRLKKVMSMAQIQMAGKSVEELGFQVPSWTLAPRGLVHMCHI